MDQIVIKILLILAFVVLAFVLLRAGGSARSQAMRTLGMIVFLCAAIIAVLFPALVNDLAVTVGVGRGADLLLYAFIIVFIGHMLTTARNRRQQDRQITELARKLALLDPQYPEGHKP